MALLSFHCVSLVTMAFPAHPRPGMGHHFCDSREPQLSLHLVSSVDIWTRFEMVEQERVGGKVAGNYPVPCGDRQL